MSSHPTNHNLGGETFVEFAAKLTRLFEKEVGSGQSGFMIGSHPFPDESSAAVMMLMSGPVKVVQSFKEEMAQFFSGLPEASDTVDCVTDPQS